MKRPSSAGPIIVSRQSLVLVVIILIVLCYGKELGGYLVTNRLALEWANVVLAQDGRFPPLLEDGEIDRLISLGISDRWLDLPRGFFLIQGYVHEYRGELNQAIAAWRQVDGLGREFVFRGDQAFEAKDWDGARAWYQRASWVRPDDSDGWFGLGNTLLLMGNAKDAHTALERAIQQDNWDVHHVSDGHFQLAEAIAELDSATQAQVLEQYLLALDAGQFSSVALESRAQFRVGDIMWQNGDVQLALDYWKAAIQLRPDYFSPHLRLGTVYRNMGLWSDSRLHLEEAARLEPESKWPVLELARLYAEMGRPSLAADAYRRVLELDPQDQQAQSHLEELEVVEP
jgi:tetratricopeptide (TPR) repeat protein